MTPQAQCIAIARAMGITGQIMDITGRGLVYAVRTESGMEERRVPNYLHDLNAMHEVENILTLDQSITYANWLGKLCEIWRLPIRATAAQRAEAFLRTLNLWVENYA